MHNLHKIITPSRARYSGRFTQELLDELMFRGDREADEATIALHEEKYDPDGSQLQNLRQLAKEQEPRAVAFFERAERRPDWFRPELIEHGQKVALSFSHHYGISLMHSLFSGAVFGRATLVTNSTGRLGSNPARRIQETGSFIGAILAPHGLEPGNLGFETAVRVRLLHGSIRSWIKRSPGFMDAYVGEPLDQTMLAMTLGLFDYLNLRSMSRLGVPLSREDIDAHHHLWRYVGYLLGIQEELLTESIEEERDLWSALVAHQAFPDLFGETFLDIVVGTVAQLMGNGSLPDSVIRNTFLHLSGGEWFDARENLLPDPLLSAFRAGSFAIGSARQWIPGVGMAMEAHGASALGKARAMAEEHQFGVTLELEENVEEREALFQSLASGIQIHFQDVSPPPS
jgi:hypothetical protein